ncbi:ABC transporter substrate-binding protein [Paenibacillus sp. S150]|uniref:substrate-binding periplasmic protein n=1 Tax=Paenibacillus sp. S150 TaxID=2749826 RepID=UPI001C59682C|nr:ABC transporter substrate-binding protein [Paenibacillus sp. S150]MBW4084967.1 amino acid ABC transporter substrate-binding protein [Paenibacillus sp. S150]
MKKSSVQRKLSCFPLCLLLLFLVTACASTQNSPAATDSAASPQSSASAGESELLQQIKQKGYILIGSSNDAPFSYTNIETGELEGIDIQILREICKRLDIPDIQLKVIDFANLLVELNNGSIDIVADAMYVKDERLQITAFTDKWYQEGEAVVIPADSDIAAKEDLQDKNVGAQPGTTFYELAQQWLDEGKIGKLTAYDNQATLMTAVNMQKIDAVITDGIVAGYTLSQDSSLKLKLLSPYEAEASGQIGAAVRFADKAFLDELNGALNGMKEDGTLKTILTDYGLTDDYYVGLEEGKTVNVK